jgi:exosortase
MNHVFHQYRQSISLGVLIIIIFWVYYPIFWGMILDWYNDENYSHGFLVPIIAGYFLYVRWSDIIELQPKASYIGLPIFMFGLVMLVLGWVGVEYFTMRSSFIVLLAGIILFLYGWEVFKLTAMPIGFLLLMVPIPYIIYDSVAFPLKLLVTDISVFTLKSLGVVVWNQGNILMFPNTVFEVADACSGIRSIMSLIAVGFAYAFLIQIGMLKKFILIFSAIPIAVIVNCLRVVITGILAQYWGAKAAEGFFHDFAGMAVFGVGMAMLIAFGEIIRRMGKDG